MKLIVGLGNPGKEYENTRHNAGFLVLDKVSAALNVAIREQKFKALMGEAFVHGEKVLLMKPQTYMNLSGEAVIQAVNYYNLTEADILVISDDLDLPIGQLRIKEKGSSGGQKGIQSIINHLHTQMFARLRVGIGKNPLIPAADYVLGKMDADVALEKAATCVLDFIANKEWTSLKETYNQKVSS